MSQVIKVGVGIVVSRGEKILMLKRSNPHGHGTWSTPGGHMEYGESPEEAAVREVKEETGLDVTDVEVVGITNDFFKESDKHYITIWMKGECYSGEPMVRSPEEISAADWFTWDTLPGPFFLTFQHFLEALKNGKYLIEEKIENWPLASLLRKVT